MVETLDKYTLKLKIKSNQKTKNNYTFDDKDPLSVAASVINGTQPWNNTYNYISMGINMYAPVSHLDMVIIIARLVYN